MDMRRAVPAAVLGMGGILAAVGIVTYASGDRPDYADLAPAPDAVVWEAGDETAAWLSTNRHGVELRLHSVAMGIGDIGRTIAGSGETESLGRGLGCQDWAVSELSAEVSSETSFTVSGEVERSSGFTGAAEVQIRRRDAPYAAWTTDTLSVAAADTAFSRAYTVTEGSWHVEAASDSAYPSSITRAIVVNTTQETAGSDEGAQTLTMLEGTGVGLIACQQDGDLPVTLHGDDGTELRRYLVDIGAAPTATPVPTATPDPDAGYTSRRVCVDDQASRAAYLTGGENVEAAFDSTAFGLSGDVASVIVGDVEAGNDFRYYFGAAIASGDVQLTVSDTGAADSLGLDADRVYPVRVTATDGTGETAFLDVGVWLDTTTLSPNDDGLCS